MKNWLKIILFLVFSILISTGITYTFIQTHLDWKWAVFFNQHPVFVWISVPFVLAGMVVPILLIVIHFFRYRKTEDKTLYKRTLWAFLLTYTLMTLLKVFTNRVDMEPFEPIGSTDISAQFRFGFLNSNSWWESFSEGWPSGHTLIAVGMAVALHPLLKSQLSRIINVLYPLLIAASVSTAFHWLSDVVSGAILGITAGYLIRRSIPVKRTKSP